MSVYQSVGNLSFSTRRIGVLLCASLIFILLFTLHFTTIPNPGRSDLAVEATTAVLDPGCQDVEQSKKTARKRRRDIMLFFFGFFYLSAVIITLQGVGAMLQLGNIGDCIKAPLQLLKRTEAQWANGTKHLNKGVFNEKIKTWLLNVGIGPGEILDSINRYIPPNSTANFKDLDTLGDFDDFDERDFDYGSDPTPIQALLYADMYILSLGLNMINVWKEEDPQSLVTNQIDDFLGAEWKDTNKTRFLDVTSTVVSTNATPALWFLPFGGAVLVFLGMMTLIDRWESCKRTCSIFVAYR
ncbi:hypothetical protein BXZ70DRAFT_910051 [Cristinia sonorae]|uniref:Uncharacterized protein n=1 Tax=Cristinia sonorae TaxID=1940300 RepID=A0A8K0UIP6_9AGAR|nr:hypothetical protein BXZ70DRAFT_910051 [Cristinia sonorae]